MTAARDRGSAPADHDPTREDDKEWQIGEQGKGTALRQGCELRSRRSLLAALVAAPLKAGRHRRGGQPASAQAPDYATAWPA